MVGLEVSFTWTVWGKLWTICYDRQCCG